MQTESLQHIPMQIYSVIKTAEIYLEIQWSPIFVLLSGYPFIYINVLEAAVGKELLCDCEDRKML